MEVLPPTSNTLDESGSEGQEEDVEQKPLSTTTVKSMHQGQKQVMVSSNDNVNPKTEDDIWEEKSNAKGFIYYINKSTGDTVWEKPNTTSNKEKNNKETVWDEWAQNGINQQQPIWEKYYDEISGHDYYHNPLTMENSWTLPVGAKAVPGVTDEDINTHLAKAEHAQYQQNRKNWQICYDKDGTPYYYNSVTGESNWVLDEEDMLHQHTSNNSEDDSGSDSSNSSDDSISSYEQEIEGTYRDPDEEDIIDRLKVGAMNITSQASEYVASMKPHAVNLSNKALGATVAGVSTMWSWVKRVASKENIEWVQKGSKQMVENLQDWVDEVVVDPNAGIEHLVETTSKRTEESVEWMLGNDLENSVSDDDDMENNVNGGNNNTSTKTQQEKEYNRITFDPSELKQQQAAPPINTVSVEKEAEKVAMEHGNFQANKLESTLDNLSANILNKISGNSQVSVDLGSVEDGAKPEDTSDNDGNTVDCNDAAVNNDDKVLDDA
eukprot:g1703.t1